MPLLGCSPENPTKTEVPSGIILSRRNNDLCSWLKNLLEFLSRSNDIEVIIIQYDNNLDSFLVNLASPFPNKNGSIMGFASFWISDIQVLLHVAHIDLTVSVGAGRFCVFSSESIKLMSFKVDGVYLYSPFRKKVLSRLLSISKTIWAWLRFSYCIVHL